MAVGSNRLGCVIVSVDGSEESMNALRWALDNLKLRSPSPDSSGGHLVIFHVQSPPSIAAGLNPGAIPFGGPSDLEVPAFAAAIEAHQRKISDAIMRHALQICSDKNVKNVKTQIVVGDPKEKVCEAVEELHADLLVMGSRSFGPIKRVSNYICASLFWLITPAEDVSGKCKQLLLKPCTMPGNDIEGYFLTNCSWLNRTEITL
ncbi:Universal stress protein PHOS34 [Camellia lanceoleosa]|uniref:Universal stress protein PHOS34 n=1 Tax=Camellia lanceoleosa TaxID=1840588 RepID=A0ACC0GUI1_9ERIC|nr:Universal stress protein PHOS34 [Camellia lanceoleosa]